MDKPITYRRSWVEIDLEQLRKNVKYYLDSLSSSSQVMAVVKANAYGHGDVIVSNCLQNANITLFAVSNISEAIRLRKAGIKGEILILGYTPILDMPDVKKYDLTQTLVSEEYAEQICKASCTDMKCQFAIDTGMNRIGLDASDAKKCVDTIRYYANIFHLNGIFTHLCVADSTEDEDVEFTQKQIVLFENIADQISDLYLPYIHCLNSAGGLTSSSHYHNIVRLGIIMYGLKPSNDFVLPVGVNPILSWKSVVSMVKEVNPGETIGYGRSYRVNEKIKVATIPTGYADGYNRLFSNKGYVLIHGQKAPIVGKICMDQMMVDVTNIPCVQMDDEVVLIGKSGEEKITADDIAHQIGSIGYEIVCGIADRVSRIYI